MKNKINNTKTPRKQKGNNKIARIEDKPLQDEVQVKVSIQEIKFGDTHVNKPGITTIYQGQKLEKKIPFDKGLQYSFNRVEDKMVFKYAVTSEGDLLGFLYLEIPQKFKNRIDFKLDDWFPVKQLETEDNPLVVKTNFMARVKFIYKAARKAHNVQLINTNTGKVQQNDEMVKTMREKIKRINSQVNHFNDDGFRHLDLFEKKMLKKKIKMQHFKERSDANKKMATTYKVEGQQIPMEKTLFYKTKQVAQQNDQLQNQQIPTKNLYDLKEYQTNQKKADKKFDDLMKELTYTKKELVLTKQKLQNLEEGQMTVDNIKLQKKLKDMEQELFEQKQQLAIQTQQFQSTFEEKFKKKSQDLKQEQIEVDEQKNQYEDLLDEYTQKIQEIEEKELELEQKREYLEKKIFEVEEREDTVQKKSDNIRKDKIEIEQANDEIEEIKERLMMERRMIFEESEKFNFEKGDLSLKQHEIKTQQEFISKQKNQLKQNEKDMLKQIEALKKKVQGQSDLLDLEKKALDDTKKNYEQKNQDLIDEKKQLKIEQIRLMREKDNNQQEVKEFMEWKKLLEKENEQAEKDLQDDYKFIDQQLNLIQKNKDEFNEFRESLQNYERLLNEQQRKLNEEQKKFYLEREKFFEKLNSTNFDIKELKKYSQECGVQLNDFEQQRRHSINYQNRLKKEQEQFKRNLDSITLNDPSNNMAIRRETIRNRLSIRQSKLGKDGINVDAIHKERQFKIKKDANDIIEDIFQQVTLKKASKDEKSKGQKIDELKKLVTDQKQTIEKLKEDLKKQKTQNMMTQKQSAKGLNKDQNNVEKKVRISENSQNNLRPGVDSQGRLNRASLASLQSMRQPEQLGALRQDVIDMLEVSVNYLELGIPESDDPEVLKTRIEYLNKGRYIIDNIFKFLNLIHNSKKEFDNKRLTKLGSLIEEWDLEAMKDKYDSKIKQLVDYIRKIRDNNDFFNFDVDNNILVSS